MYMNIHFEDEEDEVAAFSFLFSFLFLCAKPGGQVFLIRFSKKLHHNKILYVEDIIFIALLTLIQKYLLNSV